MTPDDLTYRLAVAIVKLNAALDRFRLPSDADAPKTVFVKQPTGGEVVLVLGLVFVWLPLRVARHRLGQLRERISGG